MIHSDPAHTKSKHHAAAGMPLPEKPMNDWRVSTRMAVLFDRVAEVARATGTKDRWTLSRTDRVRIQVRVAKVFVLRCAREKRRSYDIPDAVRGGCLCGFGA